MTGVYTELENVYAGKGVSPQQGGSSAEPEGPGVTEAYGRSLSPLTLPPLTGTLGLTHATQLHAHMQCAPAFRHIISSTVHNYVSFRLDPFAE